MILIRGVSPVPVQASPARVALLARAPLRCANGVGDLGLFEEVGDFGEEGWEFLLDDFPDFLVSNFWVAVD